MALSNNFEKYENLDSPIPFKKIGSPALSSTFDLSRDTIPDLRQLTPKNQKGSFGKKTRSRSTTTRNTRSANKSTNEKIVVESVVLFKEYPSPANSTNEAETDEENKEVYSDAQDNLSPNLQQVIRCPNKTRK